MYQLQGYINLSVIYLCEAGYNHRTKGNLKGTETRLRPCPPPPIHPSAQALPCSHMGSLFIRWRDATLKIEQSHPKLT